ncbi:hypothetical protein DFH08DRAFT_285290 [Mycena albidolilacea]|uniref:Uncharacterized protein n=1 Tax=Mycena albidolilacea TaxID=1033008 RepID=A0AAD6ZRK6_9AGAR|nr:hypothetical protein DFH08DRAFT_285290 [Mycena albidolilacea]
MYQADGRPRRWRYFIAINGLTGILYLAQCYNADPDARRAAGILASHLCRVDAEEYARVDFSSFDACIGYYARLREPVPQCVPHGSSIGLWSRFDVLARASPEWQDEARAIMRKTAEEVHAKPLRLPHSDSHVPFSQHVCMRHVCQSWLGEGVLRHIYCWGEQCSPQTPLLLPDGISNIFWNLA